jgi:chromate transporter
MDSRTGSALQVLIAFLRLGLTSFGGPVAHLGYFRQQFVERRRWLDHAEFAELVALCQFLPGPASSQLGMAIGLKRAGALGALAAWLGFTLPSALLLIGFARHLLAPDPLHGAPWLHGLLIAAVAVVAQAVWSMGRQFCVGALSLTIGALAAAACSLVGGSMIQVGVLAAAAAMGWLLFPEAAEARARFAATDIAISRRAGGAALLIFTLLLVTLPLAASMTANHALRLADRFFRTGSLVFGGGHVVMPLLQAQVVPPGWISNQSFLAGYALAQAVPGPLFSFAGYLGAAMTPAPNGWPGAAICLAAIFLPSFLLVFGVMPFWAALRHRAAVRSALRGVNAAVVGILLSALYNPVFTSAIDGAADFAMALLGFLLLVLGRLPGWSVLLLCLGYAIARAALAP